MSRASPNSQLLLFSYCTLDSKKAETSITALNSGFITSCVGAMHATGCYGFPSIIQSLFLWLELAGNTNPFDIEASYPWWILYDSLNPTAAAVRCVDNKFRSIHQHICMKQRAVNLVDQKVFFPRDKVGAEPRVINFKRRAKRRVKRQPTSSKLITYTKLIYPLGGFH